VCEIVREWKREIKLDRVKEWESHREIEWEREKKLMNIYIYEE